MKHLRHMAHIPQLVISAVANPALPGLAREHGTDALLTKPLAIPEPDEQNARLMGSRKN